MERIKSIQQKKYQTGDVVYAKVISVWNKYITVECLGTDIKLKISDLEYGYVANLNNLYQVGDKIKVKIKEIDTEKGILKISHKETKEDPYKNVRKTFTEGGEYLATVTGFSDNRCICIFKTRDRHNGHTSSVARNTTTSWRYYYCKGKEDNTREKKNL